MESAVTQSDLYQMACHLAGDFSNQEQAWENPPFFAHIRVCYRPLPWAVFAGYGFYIEQAYTLDLSDPYRTAVVELVLQGAEMRIRNYRPLDPARWLGCSRKRVAQLAEMTPADLSYLPGCDVIMRRVGDDFRGQSEPGNQCCVLRNGQNSYLITTAHLWATGFASHDQGFDPETNQQIWGSVAGPFQFQKKEDFSSCWVAP